MLWVILKNGCVLETNWEIIIVVGTKTKVHFLRIILFYFEEVYFNS